MPRKSLDTYEEWNPTFPLIPERSVLVSLEPVGVGTPWVESLTSYIARLASTHVVFPGVLMNKVVEPLVQGKNPRLVHISHGEKTNLLNATGLRAALAVELFESLTMRTDLRHLTLLAWAEVLFIRGLIRVTKAWCPRCYEEWRERGEIISDPLLWVIQPVTGCIRHGISLSQHCPNPTCSRTLPGLCWRSRPGYCAYCQCWLGRSSLGAETRMAEAEMAWQQWVTENLGVLLALSPTISASPNRNQVTDSLTHAVQQAFEGNISGFSRALKVTRGTVSQWFHGKFPQIDMLLRICYVLGLTLDALLVKDPTTLRPFAREAHEPRAYEPRVKWKHDTLDIQYVQQALENIITANEYPPPALTEVAQRLGYDSPVLYRCHRAACYTISARYKEYARQRTATRMHKYREELRKVALQLRAKGVSPTRGRMEPFLSQPGILRDPKIRQILVEVCQEVEGRKDAILSDANDRDLED